mgnify:CR=1 FL=1|tara:strand:+ start:248 stop:472 length:225 start_codon:yes stop_codon:yes gene_type:complete
MLLNDLLSETFGFDSITHNDKTEIVTLPDFDSMNHMIFISKLEENFKITLSGDEISKMITINDIKTLLAKKGID